MRHLILYILIAFTFGTSCKDFLTQEPYTQISINEQFESNKGVLQAVNGLYYSLEALLSDKLFYYADLQGGNITFSPSTTNHLVTIPANLNIENSYQFNDTELDSEFSAVYADAYKIINAANIILERVPDLSFLSEDEIHQIQAEALATRAFTHFLLTLLYAQQYGYTENASHPGIVYNTTTITAGVDYPARKTMAETYNLLKQDLNKALALFTNKQALDYGPATSYFNAITTQAVYARIANQMNDWETALYYADEVIRNSGVSLMDSANYIAEWEKPEEPVLEVILEFSAPRESTSSSVSSSVGASFFNYVSPTVYAKLVASGDLLQLYSTNDLRKNMFMEAFLPTSMNGVTVNKPYYFTKKFQDDPGTLCIRLSEMYLIRAEALARSNTDLNAALNDLNTIRQRAGLTAIDQTENLLNEIFMERRRELAFEGHLFYDHARFKKDVVRNEGCLSTVCNLAYPSTHFVLPLPSKSITLNENMQQNEGY